jgi:hypothetical protein
LESRTKKFDSHSIEVAANRVVGTLLFIRRREEGRNTDHSRREQLHIVRRRSVFLLPPLLPVKVFAALQALWMSQVSEDRSP